MARIKNSVNVKINLLYVAISITLSITVKLHAQILPDWENPDVNGINKEMPHAYTFLSGTKANNPMIQSLNGIWKFKWSPDPQSRPADFYRENDSSENWDNILVPGHWELQGFGTPIYTNITYPFKRDPPKVTSEPPKILPAFSSGILWAAITPPLIFLKAGATNKYSSTLAAYNQPCIYG
jgi:hypothetical protein